jgi:glycosyltransferase involved in cell wall biosynthesis
MVSGCPVVTSGRGATKEVAGNAAYLINPESAKEISQAILKILKDRRLAKSYIQKGFARVKQFSWDDAARKTLAVYKEAYKAKTNLEFQT